MTETHLEALYAFYPEVISDSMGSVFTSHQLILAIAQQHQQEYIRALHAYVDNDDPFRIVHRAMSQRLTSFDALVERVGDIHSENIFREDETCAAWRKLAV